MLLEVCAGGRNGRDPRAQVSARPAATGDVHAHGLAVRAPAHARPRLVHRQPATGGVARGIVGVGVVGAELLVARAGAAAELADPRATKDHEKGKQPTEAHAPPTVPFEEVVRVRPALPVGLDGVGVVRRIGQAHATLQQTRALLAVGVAVRAAVRLAIAVEARRAEVHAKLLLRVEVRPFWSAALPRDLQLVPANAGLRGVGALHDQLQGP
mmetsp:Transcript_17666/g.55388  ORF Transcript_17666/g.55388 Transcript_17666/m.55388 type:complete len:212 (+) Transcript_17666:32-667(+)